MNGLNTSNRVLTHTLQGASLLGFAYAAMGMLILTSLELVLLGADHDMKSVEFLSMIPNSSSLRLCNRLPYIAVCRAQAFKTPSPRKR